MKMSIIYEVASKVLFLDKGKIVEEDTPDQVFNHPKSERTTEFLHNYFRNKTGNL